MSRKKDPTMHANVCCSFLKLFLQTAKGAVKNEITQYCNASNYRKIIEKIGELTSDRSSGGGSGSYNNNTKNTR